MALVFHQPLFFLPAMFLAIVFLFSNNAPFHAILVNSVPPTIRASAMALNIVTIHVCGDVISRLGVGVLSDSLGAGKLRVAWEVWPDAWASTPSRQHLTAALLVVPFALLASALFFLWGARKRGPQTAASRQRSSDIYEGDQPAAFRLVTLGVFSRQLSEQYEAEAACKARLLGMHVEQVAQRTNLVAEFGPSFGNPDRVCDLASSVPVRAASTSRNT